MFLDFYETFDLLEHVLIFNTFWFFGFGENFKNIISMLYKEINSSVMVAEGTSPRPDVSRKIRQGCGISPLLFIMVVELLASKVNSSARTEYFGSRCDSLPEVIIIQLADNANFCYNK